MRKYKKMKWIAIFSIVVVIVCCIIAMIRIWSKDKDTFEITTNTQITTKVPVTTEEQTTTKTSVTTEEQTTTKVPLTTEEQTTTKTSVTTEEQTTKASVTTEEQTTTKASVTTEKQTTSKKLVDGTITQEETTTPKEITTQKETTIKQEQETTTNIEMKITLKIPENVMTGETFNVSYIANNCAHIEWYINGEYQLGLEKEIKPSGTLKFDKAGIYSVTVIGYTKDWKKNVSSSVYVRVYDDLSQANGNSKEHDRAMYSWGHHYIYEEYEEILQKVMELTECNILYQEISADADKEDVAAFLERRGEYNQTVYYLCGNASWAIEKDAKSMLEQVQRAIEYNKAAGEHKFVGIQFDVEPYCLDDFEENAEEYMAQYVKNSKLAYQAAHKAGLLVEICIPYWWDSAYGFDDELEELITNACDSVAVMNYYKKQKEIAHIENELELCKKLGKRIINITETIQPGLHGLTEDNTYYHDGIDAIEEMWNTLDGFFQYDKLGYAFHYLDVIIELLGLE